MGPTIGPVIDRRCTSWHVVTPETRPERRCQHGPVVVRAVVLVEGASDQAALQALAGRRGRDLGAEGVSVQAMGGITNLRAHLERFAGERIRCLCDEQEEPYVGRIVERSGLDVAVSVCVADLEDELIRALGVEAVEAVIEAAGELVLLRSMQQQPAQRDRPVEAQLRRFMGTKGGRKIRYGRLLVEALDLRRVPPPLDRVLEG